MGTVATATRLLANLHEVAAPAVTSDFPGLSENLTTFCRRPSSGGFFFVCVSSFLCLTSFPGLNQSPLQPLAGLSVLFFLRPDNRAASGPFLHIYIKQTAREAPRGCGGGNVCHEEMCLTRRKKKKKKKYPRTRTTGI